MEIRELHESELDHLLALYTHLHESDDPLPCRETIESIWQSMTVDPNLKCFGVFDDGRLISSCTLAIIPNLTRGCRPYGLIENVVTDTEHRGKGHGRALLRHALECAWRRTCYKVMLMTGRKTEQTYRFYESVGFDRHAKQAFLVRSPAREPPS